MPYKFLFMTYKHTYKNRYTYKEGEGLKKTLYLSNEAIEILSTKDNMSKYVSDLIVGSTQTATMNDIMKDIDDIKFAIDMLFKSYMHRGYKDED